jgi:hypothetical protein
MAAAAIARSTSAQTGDGFDLTYGRWYVDSTAVTYGAGYYRKLLGPLDFGLSLHHLDDSRSLDPRSLTGLELSLALGRLHGGWYATGSAGLGMRQADHNLDAHWSAGLGYGLRVLPYLVVGFEARYRAEDRWARGFWNLAPGDRKGFSLGLRIAAGETRRTAEQPRPRPQGPIFDPPSEAEFESELRARGTSEESAATAARVVSTALAVMGTPYEWGGTDDNGFDCSGLIQYAYARHGILLPRVSRDQMKMGIAVEPRLEELRPGDILGFSVERASVSHVGLYVGNGQFIHSASGGVKLSSLEAPDPDSRWWQQRLVAARRILR